MTIVAVTATRRPEGGFTVAELASMQNFVDRLDAGTTTLLSGGCIGGDAVLTRMAAERRIPTLAYLGNDTTRTDWAALAEAHTVLVRTGMTLLQRDWHIVDQAQEVYAFGLHLPRIQPRSGTWATARYAQRHGKLQTIIILRYLAGAPDPSLHLPLLLAPGSDWCICQRACHCGRKGI